MKAGSFEFDVVIAGGGFVGATLALALSALPLRVGLIEARPPGRTPARDTAVTASAPSGGGADDPRCTALAHGSRRILEALGVWARLGPSATPIRTIHVSDRGRFGATRLQREDYDLEALGYVVENAVFAGTLWQMLGLLDGPAGNLRAVGVAGGRGSLTAFAPAAVVAADCGAAAATLRVREGEGNEYDVRARLLVVADGVRSSVRSMLGIDAAAVPYRQQAVIANVTPERFHDNVAYERFTDSGPLALLPMSGGRCSLVWTVWNDDAAQVLALDDEQFLTALQERFGYRLGRFTAVGGRSAYPLALITASSRALPPRCLLVGNAATGLHPVAGQGLNLGLRDVARVAELIAEALARGEPDVGRDTLVGAARQWCGADRARAVYFTDALVRLFTRQDAALGLVRSAGLVALDLLPAARGLLARQAMGLAGRVPRLSRGLPLSPCASPRGIEPVPRGHGVAMAVDRLAGDAGADTA